MSKSKWINNKDKKPEKDGWYLVAKIPEWPGDKAPYDICEFYKGFWYVYGSAKITHWMELPELPKKRECKQ